jgi:hypothetical protein
MPENDALRLSIAWLDSFVGGNLLPGPPPLGAMPDGNGFHLVPGSTSFITLLASRIATAVTRPMISASRGFSHRRISREDFGCGIPSL